MPQVRVMRGRCRTVPLTVVGPKRSAAYLLLLLLFPPGLWLRTLLANGSRPFGRNVVWQSLYRWLRARPSGGGVGGLLGGLLSFFLGGGMLYANLRLFGSSSLSSSLFLFTNPGLLSSLMLSSRLFLFTNPSLFSSLMLFSLSCFK